MKNVAVLGYGTVGSGVVEIIEKNKKEIAERAGDEVGVKYILDLRDFPGDPYENKVTHDFNVIVNDPEVDIVVETMGGTGAAYKFTKESLEKGKSVCTSNKAVVAEYGPELLNIAKANNCSYLFEASVGGGIPIIRPLNTCLCTEKVESIVGILNGTTNFMLTKMDEEGRHYDDVLKEAQAKGYAEQNPEADVCGHDTCRKIAILTSLYMGKTVDYKNIRTEGITGIGKKDFEYAKKLGASIKLLGMSKNVDGKCLAIVAPFMIDSKDPLYGVRDVFNAIMVKGNMVGDTMFYGQGAGKLATASAVVSDIAECALYKGKNISCIWKDDNASMVSDSEMEFKYFVRVKGNDASALLKNLKIEKTVESDSEETAVILAACKEDVFLNTVKDLGTNVLNYIRIL